MPVKGLLTSTDLEKISEILTDNGYGDYDLCVVIKVQNKNSLSRINDDFFYRNNSEGTPPDVDEVNVDVGGVHFKYVVDEDGD